MASIGTRGREGDAHASAHGAGPGGEGVLRDQARRHRRWIARGARAGYVANGVIHILVGGLAALAAAGLGGGITDPQGALSFIGDAGPGRWLLVAIAAGLLAYALWALVSAALDAEDDGDDAKGIATRVGKALRGGGYAMLGVAAVRAVVSSGRASAEDAPEKWSAVALDLPAGRWILGIAALVVIGYAIYQVYRGLQGDLMERLRIRADEAEARPWILRLARFGIVARAVVFGLIGWFLLTAAREARAEEAGGVGESLATIANGPFGRVALGVVALGFVAYGLWQFARARYRELPVA